MKQAEDYKKKLEEDSYESSKPLARYQSDKDLDNLLKERELEDDPMLAYMQKKKKTKTSTEKGKFLCVIGHGYFSAKINPILVLK